MTTKLAAPTVLKKIFDRKLAEVAERKQLRPLVELEQLAASADPARGFRRALSDRVAQGQPAVNAEVKKARNGQQTDPQWAINMATFGDKNTV